MNYKALETPKSEHTFVKNITAQHLDKVTIPAWCFNRFDFEHTFIFDVSTTSQSSSGIS